MRWLLIRRLENSKNGNWNTPCDLSALITFGSRCAFEKKYSTLCAEYPFDRASVFRSATKFENVPPQGAATSGVSRQKAVSAVKILIIMQSLGFATVYQPNRT